MFAIWMPLGDFLGELWEPKCPPQEPPQGPFSSQVTIENLLWEPKCPPGTPPEGHPKSEEEEDETKKWSYLDA